MVRMVGWRGIVAAVGVALLAIGPARAQWVEASSRHFVVYSDQPEARVREFAERLERFDRAVRVARKMDDPQRSPAVKLAIYVVPDMAAVERLAGSRGVGGFYDPRVSGPIAVTPRRGDAGMDRSFSSDVVLFHEYAHHLQLAELDRPMPRWLAEGFAEFFSTPRFGRDGSVALGQAAKHRADTFAYADLVPLETMLADEAKGEDVSTMYALGWLLTHYLTFEPSRRGQLAGYVDDIAAGMSALDSAKKNFGSLGKLGNEISAYLRRPTLPILEVQPHMLKDIRVDLRRLSPGASAVMPWRIESLSGVTEEEAPLVAAEVRRVAASYPNDPLVLLTLAEAEIDAENHAAAEAAADRLLQVEPRSVEARIFKGRAIMERAKKTAGANKAAEFKAARRWFIEANKIDTEDPEPLTYFYKSYREEGVAPTANAVAALHYASNLMPQDADVRMLSAIQYARDGKLAEARRTLIPIAYSPHQASLGKTAKEMMAKLAAGDAAGALAIAAKAEKDKEEEKKKEKEKKKKK